MINLRVTSTRIWKSRLLRLGFVAAATASLPPVVDDVQAASTEHAATAPQHGAAHAHPVADDTVPEGASIYESYCAVCHGDAGDGNSHARAGLQPPPRDFTSARSRRELDRDRMLAAVSDGVPGTAMTGWSSRLDEQEIASVVDYVRTRFLGIRDETMPGESIYARSCSVCHGDNGTGAKWAGESLDPKPRNFRTANPEELTRTRMIDAVKFGRRGTAMTGFARKLGDQEVLAVIAFIRQRFMGEDDGLGEHHGAAAARSVPPSHGGDEHDHHHAGDTPAPDTPLANGLVGDADAGGEFYADNCSTCHGENGDGNGRRAYFIYPRPANFQDSAHRAHLGRDELFEHIRDGIRGREMPAWGKVLTPQQIANVVEYVYTTFINPDAGS